MNCFELNGNAIAFIAIFSFSHLFVTCFLCAELYDEFSYESVVKSFFWPIMLVTYPFRNLIKLGKESSELKGKVRTISINHEYSVKSAKNDYTVLKNRLNDDENEIFGLKNTINNLNSRITLLENKKKKTK